MHVFSIAAKAQAFIDAQKSSFVEYQKQNVVYTNPIFILVVLHILRMA